VRWEYDKVVRELYRIRKMSETKALTFGFDNKPIFSYILFSVIVPRWELKNVGRIGEAFRPQCVILFGSYAQGRPTPDSNVDLLVITEFEGRPVDKSVEIRLKVRPPFPVDLIVPTPEKVRERPAAVNFRYPGESADRATALEARKRCRHFRRAARKALGLDLTP